MEKIAIVPAPKPKTIADIFTPVLAKSQQSYTYNDLNKFNNLIP